MKKEKKKNYKIKMFFIILIILILIINMKSIARYTLNANLTEFGRICVFFKAEGMQNTFVYMEDNGMLYDYPDEYKAEAVQAIKENFESEKAEQYCKILLGGFDYSEYLENHSYEEFYDMITEMDLCLPEFYRENSESYYSRRGVDMEKNRSILYDENGEAIYAYRKVTFWECAFTKFEEANGIGYPYRMGGYNKYSWEK